MFISVMDKERGEALGYDFDEEEAKRKWSRLTPSERKEYEKR